MYKFYSKIFVQPSGRTSLALKVMKLTTLLMVLVILHVSATSLAQKVTLSEKNVPLVTVFDKIQAQTGYDFMVSANTLKNANTVTIDVKKVELKSVLQMIFRDQPLEYEIGDKLIMVRTKSTATSSATPTTKPVIVSGKVTDTLGNPLNGATVTDITANKAVITNSKGEFSLNAQIGDKIIITFIGYKGFLLTVGEKMDNLHIELRPLENNLREVTVSTGYQNISKERFVGSYSQLDSASYARRAGMGILERLDGTVNGLEFDKKSGGLNPIQIRGVSSLGGSSGLTSSLLQPLIIVDDFPFTGDLSTINPNDIENITILKDAAAASIWGTRAGNGVIVVKTKKGKYNRPLQISISSNVTITEKPNLYYYPSISSSDEIDVEEYLFSKGFYDTNLSNNTTWPVISPVVELLSKARAGEITQEDANAQINSLRNVDLRSDLNQYVYRNSIAQQHYLNLNGGNQSFSYSLSTGYNNSLNNIQGSKGSNQFTINSNTTYRPVQGLEFSAGINYSQTTDKSTNYQSPNLYPYAQLADAQGNHLAVPNIYRMSYIDTVGEGKLLDWNFRPLDEIRLADNKITSQFVRLNTTASYQFTSWLNAKISYQYVNQTSQTNDLYSQSTYFTRNLINQYTNLSQTDGAIRNPIPIGDILNLSNDVASSQNFRGQLNFNKSWNSKNNLTALIATEISQYNNPTNNQNALYGYNSLTGSYQTNIDYSTQFPIYGNNQGLRTIPNGTTYSEGAVNRFVSLIANGAYTYGDRYSIYASARRDGSNVFGGNTNAKWKPLWSTGLSWNISKEQFYAISWMPYLRLRASYGYTGNVSNLTSGLPIITYQQTQPPTNLPRAQANGAPNPDLRWEQVATTNLGLDFGLFKNRLSGNLEWYYKKSTDLITTVPFDPTTGVDNFLVNAASLKGNGFEINLNSTNITGPFVWQTNFKLSYAQSIVTKVYNGGFKASDFIEYNLNPAVGKPLYGIASYRWAGLDPANGNPRGILDGKVSTDYTAIFNDNVNNQRFFGSAVPLYYGNIMNTLSWKRVSLSFNITYRLDFYYRKPALNYSSLFNSWQGLSDYEQRWQKPGDEKITNVPSMIYPVPAEVAQRDQFYQGAEINVLRGDNLRLQDARLSYDIPRINRKWPFKSFQVFIYANNLNLILWKAAKSDYDPDYTGGIGDPTAAIPPSKTFTGGVNVSF